jgi:hypothetical protein
LHSSTHRPLPPCLTLSPLVLHLQILKYEPGQFYKQHHDQQTAHWTPQGVRVYTFFVYLSDVEAGGGTKFNDLGLVVTPKRGRAVLWPSVLSKDLLTGEPRTHHEALPVERGVKYACVHRITTRLPLTRPFALLNLCSSLSPCVHRRHTLLRGARSKSILWQVQPLDPPVRLQDAQPRRHLPLPRPEHARGSVSKLRFKA